MEQKLNLIYNKMKKILVILSLIILAGCAKDEDIIVVEPNQDVPQTLIIDELVGVKLESAVVSSAVSMNIKLPLEGTYRVKIKHGLNNELISQEKVQGKEGDNIFKVYVKVLESSSYKLELTDLKHNTIGITSFSKL